MSCGSILFLLPALGLALPAEDIANRRELLAEDASNRRELLAFSRMFCYVNADGTVMNDEEFITQGCADEPSSSPPCTVDSVIGPGNLCMLTMNENGVDKDRWETSYAFKHCSKSYKYIREGRDEDKWYCEELENTGDWSTRRRSSGRKESTSNGWWTCGWGSGYEWHDGACRDSTRYLGDECWDDSGECYNDGVEPFDGLRMACATDESAGITDKPRCIPAAYMLESRRNSCECNWFDWNFLVACGADQCNGHACVASTGPGGWRCDYQTDNNW